MHRLVPFPLPQNERTFLSGFFTNLAQAHSRIKYIRGTPNRTFKLYPVLSLCCSGIIHCRQQCATNTLAASGRIDTDLIDGCPSITAHAEMNKANQCVKLYRNIQPATSDTFYQGRTQ